jgi:hypothetical protein
LTDFLNFLGSPYVDDWGDLHDIAVKCNHVTDLTELVNDVAWDYRAMVEIEVGFTQNAVGHTGTMYENGIPFYGNGAPKYDAATGMPLYENGRPMYDPDGNPLYDNGQPMYDADGNPLDPDGNRLPDGSTPIPPLPMPEVDPDGKPIFPPAMQTASGGRTQTLAGQTTGWFEKVEGPYFEKEENQ